MNMKRTRGLLAAGAGAAILIASAALGAGDGEPAPVNPCNGTQDREEVYEFAQKPSVKKEGDRWVITFASKGKCDATVAILDKDGKIVRHLASGVLGKNAPWPFKQNSLSQKVEWDGLKDDFSKADAAGCRVRVSLGLKAEFDKNIVWDPYAMPTSIRREGGYLMTTGKDGVRYVGAVNNAWCWGRAYDKDGKYLHTFFPPPADKLKEAMKSLSHPFVKTIWGDEVLLVMPVSGFSTGLAMLASGDKGKNPKHGTDPRKWPLELRNFNLYTVMKEQPGAGEIKIVPPAEAGIQAFKVYPGTQDKKRPKGASAASYFGNSPRLALDRARDELYLPGPGGLNRLDGKTGKRDQSWFGGGIGHSWQGCQVGEVAVGPDGLIYVRSGAFFYSNWLWRMTREGKPVPFEHNAESIEETRKAYNKAKYPKGYGIPGAPIKGITAIWTGQQEAQSNGHEKGFDVSPNGNIIAAVSCSPSEQHPRSRDWMLKNGIVNPDGKLPSSGDRLLVVWDKDGKLLSPNAVPRTSGSGQGVHMDRDGNIYRHETAATPACKGRPAGLAEGAPEMRSCSSLVKYRGRGGAYPIGTGPEGPQKKNRWNPNPLVLPEPTGLTGFVELVGSRSHPTKGATVKCQGALWAYPGVWTEPGCTCTNMRHDLDDWARTWIPSPHLFSVVVLDSNGNRIARIGRYGNADDADEKCGRIHMSWPVATAASDEALYVIDHGDLRILRCKLGYHAEETVNLDGSSASAPPARESLASTASPAPGPPVAAAKQDSPAPAAPIAAKPAPAPTAPAAAAPAAAGSGPDPAVVCRGWWSLAQSYARAGRKDKAREYLQKIITQHPKTDYAARARRELARL